MVGKHGTRGLNKKRLILKCFSWDGKYIFKPIGMKKYSTFPLI
jgi:hypothetical protein